MHPETLRKRVRQAGADQGLRPDLPTSQKRAEIKQLRKENFELRRTANRARRRPPLALQSRPQAHRRWYISWCNHDRLHEAVGAIPPVEFEALPAAQTKEAMTQLINEEATKPSVR
ncbi:MAG: hypothetical protein NVSMB51_10420 [Solirubrobacteraceae bacterium]